MCRPSIGVDINPVAVLITKTKKNPIEPSRITKHFFALEEKIYAFSDRTEVNMHVHERIDYWFRPKEKRKLSFLAFEISKIEDQEVRAFFYCAFSHILKNCSIWNQKSNKPTRDLKKTPADPFMAFLAHVKRMFRGNTDFLRLLQKKNCMDVPCTVRCADARETSIDSHSVDCIVTSPPYVTSYEYADLHQLSTIWLDYTRDLRDFRKGFIGTSHSVGRNPFLKLNSNIAEKVKEELSLVHKKTAEEVATYFGQMNQVFEEIHRVLKKHGRACIVIGNTCLKGVSISNAEVFVEQMRNIGFKVDDIVKREIPSKNIPSIRNEKTGRFAKLTDKKKVLSYPTEYILIMQKT